MNPPAPIRVPGGAGAIECLELAQVVPVEVVGFFDDLRGFEVSQVPAQVATLREVLQLRKCVTSPKRGKLQLLSQHALVEAKS